MESLMRSVRLFGLVTSIVFSVTPVCAAPDTQSQRILFQYETPSNPTHQPLYNLVKEQPAADDLVLTKDNATVLIDPLSLEFMGGAEIDYVDDLIGQSFQIRNPNAVAGCGCGTSFSI